MTDKNRVVAIGLLTQGDIDKLGDGFSRMFPLEGAGDFQDLLDAIDRADSEQQKTAASSAEA